MNLTTMQRAMFGKVLASGLPKPHIRLGLSGYWMVENISNIHAYPEKSHAYQEVIRRNNDAYLSRNAID